MRDAASAAAMSDPALNRWFQRRWVELPGDVKLSPALKTLPADDELAVTGLELLHEWRRLRSTAVSR